MSARHTTTGNTRYWEIARGYQHTPRNPAPIQSEPEPVNYWIIAAPILLAVLVVFAGLVVNGDHPRQAESKQLCDGSMAGGCR